MKLFIFVSDRINGLYLALLEDGRILGTFSEGVLEQKVAEYEFDYDVVVVEEKTQEFQLALLRNRLRTSMPQEVINRHGGLENMAVGVMQGTVKSGDTALVLAFLAEHYRKDRTNGS